MLTVRLPDSGNPQKFNSLFEFVLQYLNTEQSLRKRDIDGTVFIVFCNESSNHTFKELIEEETWEEIQTHTAQQLFDRFTEISTHHYNTVYPLKPQRYLHKNERENKKPLIFTWLENV